MLRFRTVRWFWVIFVKTTFDNLFSSCLFTCYSIIFFVANFGIIFDNLHVNLRCFSEVAYYLPSTTMLFCMKYPTIFPSNLFFKLMLLFNFKPFIIFIACSFHHLQNFLSFILCFWSMITSQMSLISHFFENFLMKFVFSAHRLNAFAIRWMICVTNCIEFTFTLALFHIDWLNCSFFIVKFSSFS